MGYNLTLGCLGCRERAFVYRNGEARAVREFAELHWRRGCVKTCALDNGYEEPAWTDEDGWREILLPVHELDEKEGRAEIEMRLLRERTAMRVGETKPPSEGGSTQMNAET